MKAESAGYKRNNSGQSLVEVLLALAVITLSIASAAAVYFGGTSLLIDAHMKNIALGYARQDLETAKITAQLNFAALVSSSSTIGQFTRETIVETMDIYTKRVTVRSSWQTNPLRSQKVELVALLANWRGVINSGGDTGGSGLTGDWKNSQTLGSIDLGPGNSATDLDVKNKIVYLTSTASDPKKPDFYIVDATNGQNVSIRADLNTGPGLNAIDVANNYAYVANSDVDNQLQIIDVSNINNPFFVTSFKLPNVSGSGAVGNSIFYNNSRIYIGTKQASGPEFHIIDVSNPLNPSELGSFEVGADVNSVVINGYTAYLATSDSTKEIMVLNVADSSHITTSGTFNAPGGDAGTSLYLVGDTLYLGRASGNSNFVITDVSNPASIRQLSASNVGGGVSINGIVVRDYLAFLATSDANNEFQVWNISSSAAPTLWGSYNFPQIASGIDYESNIVYVSVRSNDALRIITSQ